MSASTRTYLLAVVGLSTVLWDLGFNLGAFGTIFFDKLFFVWVACTTILIGSLFVPAKKRPFGPFGAVVMTLPTIWLILQVWDTLSINEAEIIDIDIAIFVIAIVVTVLSLPYVARILISVTVSESLSIKSRKLQTAVIAIAVAAGLTGYFVGTNNHLFLTCQDFKVSGNDLPANCRPETK
jgi:hypothetical protein